jgi:serine-type D-Ala-D-Ala carboxypeptidase (penicillin-binding protein 5/6)
VKLLKIKLVLLAGVFLGSGVFSEDRVAHTDGVPLNSYGAVDVNAHVPLEVQVPNAPDDQVNPVPETLSSVFSEDLPAQPNLSVKSYALAAAKSGQLLANFNAYKRVPPASIAKLMLLYIVEQSLESGDLKIDQKIKVPKVAWATGGSRMFLKPGSYVSVKDLISGVAVASGNDAAVTLATHIAGTQDAFVHLMNNEAEKLGMNNTRYATVMGLPAPNEYTCAYDLFKLARAVMLDYPQYFHWFSQKWFTYNDIKQPNYNKLLFLYPDATGMKTGSTSYAGYSLVSSASQKDNPMPLIAIVLGADNRMASATGAEALLKYGFHFFKSKEFYKSSEVIKKADVYLGESDQVSVVVKDSVWVTYPKELKDKIRAQLKLHKTLKAPIKAGDKLGEVVFYIDKSSDDKAADRADSSGDTDKKSEDKIILKIAPVIALNDVAQGGFFKRMKDHVRLFWA